jgi:hypothetical protein
MFSYPATMFSLIPKTSRQNLPQRPAWSTAMELTRTAYAGAYIEFCFYPYGFVGLRILPPSVPSVVSHHHMSIRL